MFTSLHPLCRYDIVSLDEKEGAREDMEGVDWAVDYLHRCCLVLDFLQSNVEFPAVCN